MRVIVDTLTATFTPSASSVNPIPLGIGFAVSEPSETSAPYFDVEQQLYPSGRVLTKYGDEPLIKLLFSGSDFRVLRPQTELHDALLSHVVNHSLNLTRIDFAIDTEDISSSPQSVLDAWNEGAAKSRIRSVTEYKKHDETNGHTIYFGSIEGDKFVRVYDKAAELGLKDRHITRIEMQVRKKWANPMREDLQTNPYDIVAKNAIRKFVDFPDLKWWNDALDCENIELVEIPRKQNKWSTWLISQVLPSILAHEAAGDLDELQAIEQFKRILEFNSLSTEEDQC